MSGEAVRGMFKEKATSETEVTAPKLLLLIWEVRNKQGWNSQDCTSQAGSALYVLSWSTFFVFSFWKQDCSSVRVSVMVA